MNKVAKASFWATAGLLSMMLTSAVAIYLGVRMIYLCLLGLFISIPALVCSALLGNAKRFADIK